MNVTVKISDQLCREARHRAVDESKSLSAWLADLIKRELQNSPERSSRNLSEILSDPDTANQDFELPKRDRMKQRKVEFP
jgi:hypothetical protein